MHITILSSRRIDILCNKSKSMTQHSLHLNSPPGFNGVRVTRSLILCVMFCRLLFVHLYFFYWPLCCLLFFDIRILITPLASSNSYFGHWVVCPSSICKFLLPLWYLQTLLLVIELSALLWFTNSYYPVGIFKLFLQLNTRSVIYEDRKIYSNVESTCMNSSLH